MSETIEVKNQRDMKKILLLINTMMLAIGAGGGPLIMRLYYIHGGKRIWLSSLLLTVGFPITLIPITISYLRSRRHHHRSLSNMDSPKPKMFTATPVLLLAFAVIGVICGVSNYLYAYGVARLPVSTATLVMGTQLAFTAIFAFVLVKQKFTFNSVNAIVLLIFGAGILAQHAGSDRPAGESTKQYIKGFVMTLVASALSGLAFPLVELMYKRTLSITYSLVMELQMVLGFSATIFSLIGMIIHNDFKVISREAREFGLGEAKYYVILVGCAILWQFYLMGAIGIVFCASSLFSGVMVSVMLPITEVLAVIFYKESFEATKGISLVLSLWGFVSYFYGEFIKAKKIRKKLISETELTLDHTIPNP
ncbi:putative purine permease, plant [Lupinus albus]|uniref:Probable purine permease n=1 Tax=Lupinus albus TaxID=3870 RepID=A0A6A4PW85_LUPAL|nr:putative purine permease, plant [Lupinus albus]